MLENANDGAAAQAASANKAAAIAHEQTAHEDAQSHHHHTHAATSHHDGGHHLLQVEDLNVSFRMYDEDVPYFQAKQRDVQVLHGLSIAVHAGEIVAVVGASGSGKTLLADAVLGLFEPNATVPGAHLVRRRAQRHRRLARAARAWVVARAAKREPFGPHDARGETGRRLRERAAEGRAQSAPRAAVRALRARPRGCAPLPS